MADRIITLQTGQWNASNYSSGIYFYRLQAETYGESNKLSRAISSAQLLQTGETINIKWSMKSWKPTKVTANITPYIKGENAMKNLYFTTDLIAEARIHDKTNNGGTKIITSVRKELIYLFFFGAVTLAAGLNAQTLQSNLYGTDGQVLATVLSGDTLYIGGSFNYVGPS